MESDHIEPVNIGNPTEMTILELAQQIVKITGSKSEIIHQEAMLDDPKVRQPDITLARQLLGWEPKVRPEEGLEKTVEWFREN
jgi:dTDP-glucose 4,6-dehydratase